MVATALRLYSLGEWSFWVDEAHTWRDATMPMEGFLRQERALYPLPFLALRGLLAAGLLGTDEFSLRLPFALVGVLSVPVLALCGRRLIGPAAAILAAWLCAVDPWHVYWSQNARGYGLAFVFAAITVNRTLHWSESHRRRDLCVALGAMGLGTLCHPTAGLQVGAMLAFVALRRFPDLRGRSLALGCLLLVVIVWWLPELVAMLPFRGFMQAKNDPSLQHFVQTTAYYYRPILLLAAVGGLWLLRLAGDRSRWLLLGTFAAVPFLVLMVIGGQLVKITARYSICAFPVLLWLAASACIHLAQLTTAGVRAPKLPLRLAGWLLPALMFADFGVHLDRYYHAQHGDRAMWRDACKATLARERGDGRGLWLLTVNEPTVWFYVDQDHWRRRAAPVDHTVKVFLLKNWEIAGLAENGTVMHPPGGREHLHYWQRLAAAANADLAVLVTLPELQEKDDGQVLPTLQKEFDLVLHLPCFVGPKDESIYVFVPRGT